MLQQIAAPASQQINVAALLDVILFHATKPVLRHVQVVSKRKLMHVRDISDYRAAVAGLASKSLDGVPSSLEGAL